MSHDGHMVAPVVASLDAPGFAVRHGHGAGPVRLATDATGPLQGRPAMIWSTKRSFAETNQTATATTVDV